MLHVVNERKPLNYAFFRTRVDLNVYRLCVQPHFFTSFCPIGLGFPQQDFFSLKSDRKSLDKKNRTKRRGRSIVGRQDHPPI